MGNHIRLILWGLLLSLFGPIGIIGFGLIVVGCHKLARVSFRFSLAKWMCCGIVPLWISIFASSGFANSVCSALFAIGYLAMAGVLSGGIAAIAETCDESAIAASLLQCRRACAVAIGAGVLATAFLAESSFAKPVFIFLALIYLGLLYWIIILNYRALKKLDERDVSAAIDADTRVPLRFSWFAAVCLCVYLTSACICGENAWRNRPASIMMQAYACVASPEENAPAYDVFVCCVDGETPTIACFARYVNKTDQKSNPVSLEHSADTCVVKVLGLSVPARSKDFQFVIDDGSRRPKLKKMKVEEGQAYFNSSAKYFSDFEACDRFWREIAEPAYRQATE